MAAGSLTLGGNVSIALGPLGRNGEASGSVNTSGKLAAMYASTQIMLIFLTPWYRYSYSKTRGLFGGLSIEGSVIVERQDANVQAYNSPVTARLLLGGTVDPPSWASALITTLESCTGMPGNRKWIEDGTADRNYVFGGVASPGVEPSGVEPSTSYLRKKRKSDKPAFPPDSWGTSTDSGSYFSSTDAIPQTKQRNMTWDQGRSTQFETPFESDFTPAPQSTRHPRFSQSVSYTRSNDLLDSPNSFDFSRSSLPTNQQNRSLHTRSMSMANPKSHLSSSPAPSDPFSQSTSYDEDIFMTNDRKDNQSPQRIAPKPELTKPLLPHEGVARAIALYDFHAVEVDILFPSYPSLNSMNYSPATYLFPRAMWSLSQKKVIAMMIGT